MTKFVEFVDKKQFRVPVEEESRLELKFYGRKKSLSE